MEITQKGVLYMGSLRPYMDRNFIHSAFSQMGENIVRVHMKVDYYTRKPAYYCFVEFPGDFSALLAMHKCNKKVVPGSHPPIMFNLKHTSLKGKYAMKEDYSVFVGGLSRDVDDSQLFIGFAARYPSVRKANVILNDYGSRGFGFVRFAKEEEQKDAVKNMNGFVGIGFYAISVKMNTSDKKAQKTTKPMDHSMARVHASGSQARPTTSATANQQYSIQYCEQYPNNYTGYAAVSSNNYCPMNPGYDYTQQQTSFLQSPMIPVTYQAPLQRPPLGIHTDHFYWHAGQQQPRSQESLMSTAFQPAFDPEQMGTPPVTCWRTA